MKIEDLRELLKDKRVEEEIKKHLWIESQKAGYSIGIERATDEWLRLYAVGWMKYNMPDRFEKLMGKTDKNGKNGAAEKKPVARKKVAAKKAAK